jgi:phosphoribosylformylglycinamidine synthase subunit PurS
MVFPVVVDVTLRDGVADPEGATIERALPALGFSGVHRLRAGRTFRFEVEAVDEATALATAAALAERLLSNPVIEQTAVRLGGA